MTKIREIVDPSEPVYVYVTTSRVRENVASGKDMPTVNVSYKGSQQQCHEVVMHEGARIVQTAPNTASPVGASVYAITLGDVDLWIRS